MAQIGINVSVSGLSGQLLIRWVKASAPLAEVGRSIAFAFPVDMVYTIPNLNRVVYIVQLWRTDDGVSLDQLIKDWAIDASMVNVAIFKTYQYQVGRGWDNTTPVNTGTEVWADPVDLNTSLTDERIDGIAKEDMIVHQSGYGRLLDAEYDLLAGGGITLLNAKTFDQDVPWSITVSTLDVVSLDPGPDSGGAMFDGVETLTADQDFDDGTTPLANKLVIANWPGTVGTITFPDLTLIADGTHVTIQTQGGLQNYLTLQFDPGDTVKFLNQDVNIIYLARCESISLYFFGGACYVTNYKGNAQIRGNIQNDYDSARSDNGSLLYADEATGELDRDDYPGLYALVAALTGTVPLGTAIGQWSYDSGGGVFPNKRKYGIDTGAFTFRVPHLSGMVGKAAAVPGVYEADQNKAHGHGIKSTFSAVSGSATADVMRGSATGSVNTRGAEYSGTDDKTISPSGGTEVRVKSFAQKPFVIM